MKKLALTLLSALSIATAHSVCADSAKLTNPANGHSYQRFDTVKTWQQAVNQCDSLKGTLLSITSQEENDWIVSQLLNAQNAWLGSTDRKLEGVWKSWTSGEAIDYTNWKPGEPDNGAGAEEDFLQIYPDGTWGDSGFPENGKDSSIALAYICEWSGQTAATLKTTYSQIITVPDINANNSPEFALLGADKKDYTLTVIDSSTQSLISHSTIRAKAGYTMKSLTVANDSDRNGAAEVAILFTKNKGKISELLIQDTLTGSVLSTIDLPNQ